MSTRWIGSLLLFAAVVMLSGIHGSLAFSFFSLLLLVVLCGTAYPITKSLFADRNVALILSFTVGYIVHSLLLSFAGLIFGIHQLTFTLYIGFAILIALFLNWKMSKHRVDSTDSNWTKSDWSVLFAWLFTTLAITAVPFLRVGEQTAAGFAYRAYFNADFFRNMAVSGSLASSGIPPENPYLAGNSLHYYWFFHLLPAFWNKILPRYRADFLMVQFSIVSALMFVSTLYVTLREFVKNRKTLLFLLPLFAIGDSYEGLYLLEWLKRRNEPWSNFVNFNVDGILRWNWKAPQIDTLYRALLYAPQHLLALSVLLMALLIWKREIRNQETISVPGKMLFYVLIFSALGFSAFVGATLILGAALIVLIQTLQHPRAKWKEMLLSGALGILFLAIYFFPFQMFQAGSQSFDFGPDKIILAHFPAYFILNWGALLVFGIAGVFYRSPLLPNRILLFFLAFCFLLIFFVRIMLAGFSDISLKVGHFSHVILLLLAAGAIDRALTASAKNAKWLVLSTLIFVLPAGLTWAMDFWNTIDIQNRRFTTYVKPGEASVAEYIRRALPARTVVVNYSPHYDDFMRDILPPFSRRPVYLGDRIFSRIFQVPEELVQARTKVVESIFRASSSEDAWRIIGETKSEYVFVTDIDQREWNLILQKFAPPHFSLLIQDGPTALFRRNP
jgi:hypothetical protein